MTFFAFLLGPGLGPFVVSGMVILFLGIMMAFGLGFSHDSDVGHDFDHSIDHSHDFAIPGLDKLFEFLNLSKVPFTVWLVMFCTFFTMTGIFGQMLAFMLLGSTLNAFLASGLALIPTIGLTKVFSAIFANKIPMVHTTAIHIKNLVGQQAQITIGTASEDRPAEARIVDQHGTVHYINVITSSNLAHTGDWVLLEGYNDENGLFIGRK